MTKPNVFLTADLHLGHKGVCSFLRRDGTKLRPWNDPDEMDEALVSNWNLKVRPIDKVYVLGDVVINRKALKTIGRLNGKKILIKGNHDIFKATEYLEFFEDIRSSHPIDGMIMTHIPIHPNSLSRWRMNIHGHLHYDVVTRDDGGIDNRYVCVSVEHTNFAPIEFGELNNLIARQHSWSV